MTGPVVSLADLRRGERARVEPFADANPLVHRLSAMGLLPDTEVTMVRVAPLGDPVEIAFRGMRLSLRQADAATVPVVRLG